MKTDTRVEGVEIKRKSDVGGVLIAVVLMLVAIIAIWDTTDMTDADSFIFPRAVALAMIGFCMLFIVLQILAPSIRENDGASAHDGSTPRRIGLVSAMIGSSLLMPWLGFLVSGALAFGSIMMLAMYDKWTLSRRLIYSLSGMLIVLGFYFMFAKLLLVPLPVGTFFE